MRRFGISIYGVSRKIRSGEFTPVQAFHRICDMGAEVVELVPFGFDLVKTPELRKDFKQASRERSVPIGNYSLNANFLLLTPERYAEEMKRVKSHMDMVSDMEIATMRVDSASFSRPMSENTMEKFQEEIPVILGAYEELCDYAKPLGITVLLENHGFHANGSERVRQILTGVKRENFAHQLDVGNYTCVDDIPEIAVKKLIPFAKTIHMKDFYIRPSHRDPGGAEEFNCENSWFRSVNGTFLRGSILGQGDIDIWNVMKTIKESAFDGDFYLEYEGMEECEYGTAVSFANMKRIYGEV
ncbi:MAG: sugar phosphate isomerase/epimerase [Ruminococcaceae bacterium]|nr:sugar phosphate isomerase/epimerase [Oscillospiraceae bacterium]